jgi:hypothetical protein
MVAEIHTEETSSPQTPEFSVTLRVPTVSLVRAVCVNWTAGFASDAGRNGGGPPTMPFIVGNWPPPRTGITGNESATARWIFESIVVYCWSRKGHIAMSFYSVIAPWDGEHDVTPAQQS